MLRDARYRMLLAWSLPIAVACGMASFSAQRFATAFGSGQPPARDLLLAILPPMQLWGFVVWGPVVLTVFLAWVLSKHPEYIPFTIKTIALLFAVRALFMVLTPLGIPHHIVDPGYSGVLKRFVYDHETHDFFFSGHTAYPFICALIFWQHIRLRWAFLVSSVLFGVSVLLAHAHYSIDVFAVPFMASGVLWWAKKLFHADVAYIASVTPTHPLHSSPDA